MLGHGSLATLACIFIIKKLQLKLQNLFKLNAEVTPTICIIQIVGVLMTANLLTYLSRLPKLPQT